MLVWAYEGITDAAAAVLSAAGHYVYTHRTWYPWIEDHRIPFALWTRLSPFWGPWHPDVVAWKPVLVATPCTDSSHCDFTRKKGVKVLSLRDCGDLSGIRATVEHTIVSILSLTRRIPSAVESVRRGEWDRMRWQGTDLAGKSALVIGWGRIGKAVGETLETIGMDVHLYEKWMHYEALKLKLRQADLVTVHADLNETSRGMFGRVEFAAMKPGALFINTARGAIVDEAALLDALESGHLGGAALDVLIDEPPKPDNPLLRFARENPERLIVTPHLGGCTRESMERAEVLLAKRLVEELEKC